VRDKLFTAFKIIFSFALVALAFSFVDLRLVRAQLAQAQMGYFVLAVLLYMLAIVVNSGKWQVLLRAQGVSVPFPAVIRFMFVGFFFNNFLPMVGGDVMRAFSLARYTDRAAESAVSVIVDRIIGLMAYMASAALAAAIIVTVLKRTDLEWLEAVALIAFAVLAGGFAILLSRRLRLLVSRVFAWRFLKPLAPTWQRTSAAFDAYRFQYRALATAFGVALLGIVCTALVNWCLSRSMGGLMPLTFIFLINPLIALLQIIPISVGGGLGVNQAAYPFFWGLVGVPAGHAVAVSLLMQAVVFLGSLPGGFFWMIGRRQPAQEPAPSETA
jgi:glycosyltransferase 2 family protein